MSTRPSDPQANTDPKTKPENGADDNDRQRDHGDAEGEDEGGAYTEGDDSGLKENQKPVD